MTDSSSSSDQLQRPLKIVHVITGLETGGAEMMLCKLVQGTARLGCHSEVVSLLPPGEIGERIVQQGTPVHTLGMKRGAPSPGSIWKLRSIIRKADPDLVVTWLYHADLLGLVAAKLAGRYPVVWNIRCADMDLSKYPRQTTYVVRLLGLLSRMPAAIFTNSSAAVDVHKTMGYADRPFTILPNGFDTTCFVPNRVARKAVRRELGLGDDTLVAGSIGRWDPMKDYETFCAAIGRVAQKYPQAAFILAGKGLENDNRELKKLLNTHSLRGKVKLLGRRNDVERIMNAMDVFVLSSRSEGFPNVVGEAMCCGIPCVTTDAGDCRLVVGDTGTVVDRAAPEALAAAICNLFEQSQASRSTLGKRARERVVDNWSLETVSRKFIDCCSKLTKQM